MNERRRNQVHLALSRVRPGKPGDGGVLFSMPRGPARYDCNRFDA
ncbi:MAG TPA: hypothetical protein VMS17_15190 [Gemmataceae bacterium]|nr:hypothetical protein [Gemmataceae bacterium]